jgi:hypothetical protein
MPSRSRSRKLSTKNRVRKSLKRNTRKSLKRNTRKSLKRNIRKSLKRNMRKTKRRQRVNMKGGMESVIPSKKRPIDSDYSDDPDTKPTKKQKSLVYDKYTIFEIIDASLNEALENAVQGLTLFNILESPSSLFEFLLNLIHDKDSVSSFDILYEDPLLDYRFQEFGWDHFSGDYFSAREKFFTKRVEKNRELIRRGIDASERERVLKIELLPELIKWIIQANNINYATETERNLPQQGEIHRIQDWDPGCYMYVLTDKGMYTYTLGPTCDDSYLSKRRNPDYEESPQIRVVHPLLPSKDADIYTAGHFEVTKSIFSPFMHTVKIYNDSGHYRPKDFTEEEMKKIMKKFLKLNFSRWNFKFWNHGNASEKPDHIY